MRIHGDKLEQHADLSKLSPFLNDMVVDRQGRAYVGDFGYDVLSGEKAKLGPVILVATRRTTSGRRARSQFAQMARWSPPTAGWWWRRVTRNAWRVPDQADGSLDETAIHTALEGSPDGICLDAEGAIWVALFDKDRFDRVLNGKVVETIETPGRHADRLPAGRRGRPHALLPHL